MSSITLPQLLPEYEPTRATLHAYALAIGAIARTHGIAHPNWWHVSLSVRPDGLATDAIPLPDGGALAITLDVKENEIVVRATDGTRHGIDLSSRPTGTEVGEALITATAEFGLADNYERDRFENTESREYDPVAAAAYFNAFVAVANVFEKRRASLGIRVSPVQVWPHGFDLSFEWFGTKTERYGDDLLPSQLNLGFYPGGDRPYFYSNPWPFVADITNTDLPAGARWNTEGWSGGYIAYDQVREANDPAAAIHQFADAVFSVAKPTLEMS